MRAYTTGKNPPKYKKTTRKVTNSSDVDIPRMPCYLGTCFELNFQSQ